MDKRKPDCYKCIHRGNVPGDAHSCCRHPKIESDGWRRVVRLLNKELVQITKDFGITAEPHGIRMGWFMWPVNFDPVWLLTCKMFEEKKT